VGLRPMSDVDLLVDPGDVCAARSVLGRLGFVPPARGASDAPPRGSSPGKMPPARPRPLAHHGQVLVDRSTGLPIEIHWALVPGDYPLVPDTRVLMARSVASDMGGAARVFAPADAALHAAVHMTHHSMVNMARSLADLCALLPRAGDLDEALPAWAPDSRLAARGFALPLVLAERCEAGAASMTTRLRGRTGWSPAREAWLLRISEGALFGVRGGAARERARRVLFQLLLFGPATVRRSFARAAGSGPTRASSGRPAPSSSAAMSMRSNRYRDR
ncbi:MAG: hypothetical protein EHM24_06420, partial [Acidobacteria bacterium]